MTRFKHWVKPKIVHAKPTRFGWTVYYPENFYLSKNTDIAWGVFINAKYGVRIEEDVQIGPYVCILSDNTINGTFGSVTIKRGARIGAYSLILPNVVVGENEFVKARSIRK